MQTLLKTIEIMSKVSLILSVAVAMICATTWGNDYAATQHAEAERDRAIMIVLQALETRISTRHRQTQELTQQLIELVRVQHEECANLREAVDNLEAEIRRLEAK